MSEQRPKFARPSVPCPFCDELLCNGYSCGESVEAPLGRRVLVCTEHAWEDDEPITCDVDGCEEMARWITAERVEHVQPVGQPSERRIEGDERHGWQRHHNCVCVECPDCAFLMHEDHEINEGGAYACPNCEPSEMAQALAEVKRGMEMLDSAPYPDCDEVDEAYRVIRSALKGVRAQPSGKRIEGLDDLVGLHESIEVIYVVDGYEASLVIHDGATTHRSARGNTVLGALRALILHEEPDA